MHCKRQNNNFGSFIIWGKLKAKIMKIIKLSILCGHTCVCVREFVLDFIMMFLCVYALLTIENDFNLKTKKKQKQTNYLPTIQYTHTHTEIFSH